MDSPNRTQNRITGWVVSTKPTGWNPSRDERLPSWKIQTRAPKLATMDRVFMISAFAGRTTDRRSRNSTRYVDTTMKTAVRGKSAATRETTSVTSAAPPPTRTLIPGGGASGPVGLRRSATSDRPSSRFGPNGVVTVNAVRSPLVVAARAVATNRSRGPFGSAYRSWYWSTRRRGSTSTRESTRRTRGSAASRREYSYSAATFAGAVAGPSVRIAIAIGANSPSPKALASRSNAARDGTLAGRIVESGALKRTWRNGDPRTTRTVRVGTSTATGCCITRRARRAHGPFGSSLGTTLRTASASIRPPTIARTAGSRVRAETTARNTTTAPAMPTERRIMNSNR